MSRLISSLFLASFFALGLAQFPAVPTDLTVVKSEVDSKVTISFKETDICETTSGVKAYSGFVHLPAGTLSDVGDYDVNSYFLYFEARNDAANAPLALYLAGGPGESSTYAALASESGPCIVNVDGTDTTVNPWSFNNYANMLYIDQPVMTGFSYGHLINATYNYNNGDIEPITGSSLPPVNSSFGYGTYPNQGFKATANTTVQAAATLWHFAENWLTSFPGYTTTSNKIGVWGNSYGGYWVPETAAQFSKNLKSLSSDHPLKSKNLVVDTMGITNGCVDIETAITGYPDFAYNNTYDHPFGTKAEYEGSLHNITKSGGALDLIKECRALGEQYDPSFSGSNSTVNKLCEEALFYWELYTVNSFPQLSAVGGKRDDFDVARIETPYTCDWDVAVSWYLNTASVQQALGVPLNFTYDSNVVTIDFGLPTGSLLRPLAKMTGDPVRQNGLPNVEYLLSEGTKVAFIFGDRDFRCPWTGGESTALAAKWKHQTDFVNAGYEEIQGLVTPADKGGNLALVKQYGQFSFSRVKNSGHAVSAYSPETVSRIFDRTIMGVDVATGKESIENGYHTTGPKTSWSWRNVLPKSLPGGCMVEGQFTKTNPWRKIAGGSG